MTDKKITQLNNITGANLVDADEFVVVDISADETKAITLGELKEAFDSGSGFVRITGDTMTGDLSFGDNDKAIFGAGSDLQIYHDGDHSWIKDVGTGDLTVSGDNLYLEKANGTKFLYGVSSTGQVRLYYGDDQKFITTSTGVDVTGTITSDEFLFETGTGNNAGTMISTDGTILYSMVDSGGSSQFRSVNGAYSIRTGGDAGATTNTKERATFASNGDISFYDDQGSSQSFYWDASAESLGIGTTSFPNAQNKLTIQGNAGASGAGVNVAADEFFIDNNGDTGMTLGSSATGTAYFAFADPDVAIRGGLFYDHSTDDMGFRVASQTRMTLDNLGNLDVTGTITSDGLTVDGVSTLNNHVKIDNGYSLGWGDITTRITGNSSTDLIQHYTAGVQRMRISSNGDISFYATDGTTQAFHWDAADERLGLGTTDPDFRLDVRDSIATVTNASHSVAMFANENTGADANTFIALKTRQGDSALRERAVLGAGLQGTSGGYFSIWTRPSGSALTEKVRVTGDGNMRIGNTTQEITGLTQTNLVVSSNSGGEIVAYRNDNGVVAGDFVGAFLFGNDDNNTTEDHFAGMWAKSASTDGSMNLYWAAGANNYETDTPQMTLDNTGALTVDGTDTEAVSSQLLKVRNSTTGEAVTIGMYAKADNGGDGNSGSITFDAGATGTATDNQLRFSADHQTDTTPDMVITGSGDVGIGRDPRTRLEIASGNAGGDAGLDAPVLRITNTTPSGDWDSGDVNGKIEFYSDDTSGNAPYATAFIQSEDDDNNGSLPSGALTFGTATYNVAGGAVERMRISSSGNLLVGKTVVDNTTQGARIYPTGRMSLVSEADNALILNRRTTDGDIAVFRKDGSTVGSIAAGTGDLIVGNGNVGLRFNDSITTLVPRTTSDDSADGTINIGASSARFKDLYLSGGVYLGGTGADNKLDSYEQGTWSPVIADAASGGSSGSANVTSANYTKVGRQVTVSGQLTNIVTTGMTSNQPIYVRNLPFASMSNNFSTCAVKSDTLAFQGGRTNLYGQLGGSDSWINFQVSGSGIAETNVDVGDITSGSTDIAFSITYFTAS